MGFNSGFKGLTDFWAIYRQYRSCNVKRYGQIMYYFQHNSNSPGVPSFWQTFLFSSLSIDLSLLTCICLMAGVPNEMTFNTTSTVKLCQSIIVMTSQRDNTMRHDNALPVTCHSRCASHQTMHMSYRSKTYTWGDVILVKRSMIRVSEANGNLAESYTDIHQSVGTSSSVAQMWQSGWHTAGHRYATIISTIHMLFSLSQLAAAPTSAPFFHYFLSGRANDTSQTTLRNLDPWNPTVHTTRRMKIRVTVQRN